MLTSLPSCLIDGRAFEREVAALGVFSASSPFFMSPQQEGGRSGCIDGGPIPGKERPLLVELVPTGEWRVVFAGSSDHLLWDIAPSVLFSSKRKSIAKNGRQRGTGDANEFVGLLSSTDNILLVIRIGTNAVVVGK